MLVAPPQIEILDDLTRIDETDWNRLLAKSATRTIFQTAAWQRAWWDSFGRGTLLVFAIRENEQLNAIAPLFADHGMVFFVGSGGSDYLDFIGMAHRPNVLREILETARNSVPGFAGFRFYHLPDESPTGKCLRATAREVGLDCFDEGSLDAPALRFSDWPDGKRAPADKKSLVRHERAMTRIGHLAIEHFSEHRQIEPLLDSFFDQHIRRWKGTATPSLFLDSQQRRFYRTVSEVIASRGWLRFTRVSLDGAPAAFHFGYAFRQTFLWYKPSFDIERAQQSPGEVLLRNLLLQARLENVEFFDFGLGDEDFKSRFATRVNTVRTWGLYPHK